MAAILALSGCGRAFFDHNANGTPAGDAGNFLDGAIVDSALVDGATNDGAALDTAPRDADPVDATFGDAATVDSAVVSMCTEVDDKTVFLFLFSNGISEVGGYNTINVNGVINVPSDSICGGNDIELGRTGRVQISPNDDFDIAEGSADIWFLMRSTSGTHTLFSRDSDGLQDGEFEVFMMEGGRFAVRYEMGGMEHAVCTPAIAMTNEWMHVGINFGAAGVGLWVDGFAYEADGDAESSSGGTLPCGEGNAAFSTVGNANPFLVGAGQRTAMAGTGAPATNFSNGARFDDFRLSAIRRDFSSVRR